MIMDIARCVTVYTAQAFARESGGDRFRVWLRCDNELRLAGPHRRRGASRRFNGAAAHEPRRPLWTDLLNVLEFSFNGAAAHEPRRRTPISRPVRIPAMLQWGRGS